MSWCPQVFFSLPVSLDFFRVSVLPCTPNKAYRNSLAFCDIARVWFHCSFQDRTILHDYNHVLHFWLTMTYHKISQVNMLILIYTVYCTCAEGLDPVLQEMLRDGRDICTKVMINFGTFININIHSDKECDSYHML